MQTHESIRAVLLTLRGLRAVQVFSLQPSACGRQERHKGMVLTTRRHTPATNHDSPGVRFAPR
jgi:hypothetical protein